MDKIDKIRAFLFGFLILSTYFRIRIKKKGEDTLNRFKMEKVRDIV